MKRIVLVGLAFNAIVTFSQTSSLSTGNWSDPSIWSTGVVPPTTVTVNADHSIVIDQNISVTTGTFNFGSCSNGVSTGCSATTNDEYITDSPGGTAYTLNTTGGTINVKDGTTTFEGAATLDNVNLVVYRHATLILGTTQFLNQSNITVYGTLIINGDLNNNNNGSGTFNIQTAGVVYVNGNYTATTGNVDITGGGDIFTTGTITTNGSSDLFGSTNDCTVGPCSGRSLCEFSLSISANQVICNSAAVNASTPTDLTSTVSGNGGALTYSWQTSTSPSGFSNATSGTPPVPTAGLATGTNTNSTYTVDPSYYSSGGTNYFRLYVYDAGGGGVPACGAFSPSVSFISVGNTGWLGTTNDWHTTSNWCNNTVPTSSSPTTVTINTFLTGSGKFQPVISAAAEVRNLTVNSSATVTISGANTLNIYGDLTTNGTLTSDATSTVAFVATNRVQNIDGNAVTNFSNLTINNTFATQPAVTISSNNRVVSGTLTLTSGNVDLNGFTLTVGTSAASTGNVSRTGGWLYGGFLQRYFGTAATTLANGLFPIGSSIDYRPFSVGYTSGLTTGGYVRISHSGTQYTSQAVSFFDDPPTNSVTVLKRSDSFWTATTNGISGGGSGFEIEAGGTSFSWDATLSHFRVTRAADVVGVNGTTSGSISDPRIQRTGLTATDLANTFYVGSINLLTPLPITLSDFSASLSKEGVELNWTTLTEENADFFQVEKSTNGIDFNSIAKVAAHGNSLEKIDYYLLDQNTNFSKAYYRLKNVDLDGAFTYSKIVSVEKQGFINTGILVYPNPVENRVLNVQIGDGSPVEGIISLCDLSGKSVSSERRDNVQGEYQVTDNVPIGFYLLKVQTLNARQTVKIVIQ